MLVHSHVTFKLKLEEIVGDLGPTLPREDEHLVPTYSYWEVTAGGRNLATLFNLGQKTQSIFFISHQLS